jgi:hypothetical protein
MGLMARVLEMLRLDRGGDKISELQYDLGSNTTATGQHFSSPGDDANPMPQDYVMTVSFPELGNFIPVGYIDPKNADMSKPGEKRIYSRDSSGTLVADIILKNDGGIEIKSSGSSFFMESTGSMRGQNSNGFFELTPAGVFTASSISVTGTIDAGGTISSDSIQVNGKELDNHLHSGVSTGGGNTGPIV